MEVLQGILASPTPGAIDAVFESVWECRGWLGGFTGERMNRSTVTGSRLVEQIGRGERAVWFAYRWALMAGLATFLAAWIRLRNLDQLTFRIDEGYSLTYSRQSWANVLGWHGFYAPHPPLFFALAKLANIFVREEIAARS